MIKKTKPQERRNLAALVSSLHRRVGAEAAAAAAVCTTPTELTDGVMRGYIV